MGNLAERVGFEPTVGFPLHSLSRRALSTAQTPLRGFSNRNRRVVCAAMYPICLSHFGCHTPNDGCGRRQTTEYCCCGLASCGEKRLQDGGGFSGANARGHLDAMIEPRISENLEAGANGAAFWVIATVDQTGNSRLDHGSRAH